MADEYYGFPYLSEINPIIREQIQNVRPQRIKNALNKTAWIKATPGVAINGNRIIMKNIASNTDKIYDPKRGFKPPAGITSVSVETTTKTGGTRTATINWTCYGKEALNELAPFFLNPGKTILLEWGWADGVDYCISPEEIMKLNGNKNKHLQHLVLEKILSRELKSKGNYSALFGIVKNFTWGLGEDFSFNCQTEITSMGELLLALDLNNQIVVEDTDSENKETIKNFFERVLGNKIFNISSKLTKAPPLVLESKTDPNTTKEIETSVMTNQYYTGDVGQTHARAYRDPLSGKYFITWGFLEQVIINENLAYQIKGSPLFKMNSNLRIGNHPNLRSNNLDVCIIAHDHDTHNLGINFDMDDVSGDINNIWLSYEMVKREFLSANTVYEALKRILNNVNDACGNFWDFKFSSDGGFIRIVDQYYTKKTVNGFKKNKDKKAFEFTLSEGNSILKNINLSSKFSGLAASELLLSAHADDSTQKSRNASRLIQYRNFTDQFMGKLELTNNNKTDYKDDKKKPESKFNTSAYSADLVAMTGETDEKVHENREISTALPIDVDFDLEGIGGLRLGDAFTIDAIPDNFSNNTCLYIKRLGHTIDNNGWATRVTGGILVSDEYKPFKEKNNIKKY